MNPSFMLPFLIGYLKVISSDGIVTQVKDGNTSAASDDQQSASTSQTGTPAKHSRHASSDGLDSGAAVPIVAIVFVFLWLIIKALMAPFTQRNARRNQIPTSGAQALSEEEQAVLVKLQRTIVQMESRIESLETILIDEHRTKEKYGHKI